MELTKYAQAIKNELAMELAKQGSSLEEFEHALANVNTGEGVFKIANDSSALISKYMDQGISRGLSDMGSLPGLAIKGSLAGGALAGLTFDEMDKSVDQVNRALQRERQKVDLIRKITNNLKKEHGIE
jgi:hypothetical protein